VPPKKFWRRRLTYAEHKAGLKRRRKKMREIPMRQVPVRLPVYLLAKIDGVAQKLKQARRAKGLPTSDMNRSFVIRYCVASQIGALEDLGENGTGGQGMEPRGQASEADRLPPRLKNRSNLKHPKRSSQTLAKRIDDHSVQLHENAI
jgi:hypothetical protein